MKKYQCDRCKKYYTEDFMNSYISPHVRYCIGCEDREVEFNVEVDMEDDR